MTENKRRWEWELITNELEFLLGVINILKLDSSDICITVIILKTTEFYILTGWCVCHMNHIPMKVLLKKKKLQISHFISNTFFSSFSPR